MTLRNALTCALLAWAIVLAILSCFFVYHLDLAISESRGEISRVSQQAARNIAQTSANTNAILLQVGLAADQLRRATERQEEYNAAALKVLAGVEESRIILTADASKVLKDAGEATVKAGTAMEGLKAPTEALTGTLDTLKAQIGAIGGLVSPAKATLEALQADAEGLRPAIQHLDDGAGSLAEIAKTGDIATRPYRKQANIWKTILWKALGIFKKEI